MCKANCTPRCFVDMDGVLTDFHNYFQKWLDRPVKVDYIPGSWDTVDQYCYAASMSLSQFWGSLGSEFWATMPWTKEGWAILTACEREFGEKNVCILSSPANAESAHGKTLWLKSQLPNYLREGRVLLGRDKRFVACPFAVLVDDGDHNVEAFREYGGIGVLVPRYWNSTFDLREDCEALTIAAIARSRSIIENIKKDF